MEKYKLHEDIKILSENVYMPKFKFKFQDRKIYINFPVFFFFIQLIIYFYKVFVQKLCI